MNEERGGSVAGSALQSISSSLGRTDDGNEVTEYMMQSLLLQQMSW